MQNILAFFNRHKITINSIIILFWLFIIGANYIEMQQENNFDEKKGFFIIAFLFLFISFVNLGKALKEKRSKN